MSELLLPKVDFVFKRIFGTEENKDVLLKKAMTTLEFLSQDRQARELYEMRQRALHDLRSMTEGAREEGRDEGRKEGRMEETRTAILDYLESHFDERPAGVDAALSAITDLEQLKKLRREVFKANTLQDALTVIKVATAGINGD